MQLSNAPGQLTTPFASGGSAAKNTIPVPSQIGITPGAASYTDGFPPLTMESYLSGGIPPSGLDFNGILNAMTATEVWACAGGGFPYNSTFSTAIGGYPKGARVLRADGTGYWFSSVDNNTTDPDTGGAGWTSITPTLHKQTFTASGTFIIPTGTNVGTAFKWTILGGGGAGGSVGSAQNGAGGGGAGGTAKVLATGYTAGSTIAVTVGAAGAASSIASGTQTITTVTAGAGAAGSAPPSSSYGGAGGLGGTTTNGDADSSNGGDGQPGVFGANSGHGGPGGASSMGGGGRGATGAAAAVNGGAGEAYGSGGGGGNGNNGAAGGAGGAGIVVVEWVL